MQKSSLIAFGGGAAMTAGILRTLAAFAPNTISPHYREALYLATDVFILLGVIGLFSSQEDKLDQLGFGGFLATVIGILVIRSNSAFAGANLYPFGSLLLLIGLIALGFCLRRIGALSTWIVGAWCLSLLLGIVAALFATLNVLPVAAGLMFAAGFFGAGYELRLAGHK